MNRDFKSGFVVFLIVLSLITGNQLCNASFKPLYKMSSVAGGGFDDGLDAKQVCLAPSKVKFDRKTENIYISDRINNRIRMFDAMSGKMSTIVGNGLVGYSGDGQAATLAHINNPGKVEVSSSSDIYFADTDNHRIRKVFANGTITTIAGCGQFGFDLEEKSPVLAFEARINYPKAVLLSSDEKTLYITDTSSHMIKALSFETGLVSIVAGSLYRDSSSNSTIVQGPISLALSPLSGEVYFVDDDGIKKITNEGKIEMVAGGNSKHGGDGGLAINAGVSAIDIEFLGTSNTLLIADGNNRIRIIGTNGIIETYAGNGNVTSSVDGEKALDSPVTPFGVSTSNEGEVFFAEYGRVSVVTVDGLIRHVAGNGKLQYLGDGSLATQSQLFKPRGVAVSPSGELFISDSAQDTIRKVSSEGLISTIAGGTFPIDGIIADDVNPLNTFLNNPSALEFSSSSGELFLSDSYNFRVRKISKENLISTIVNHTSITRPHGIALYNDLVYVADSQSNRVVKVDKNDGSVIIIAGNGTAGYSGDGGLATEAQLFNVSGVAVLPNGEILIADTNNHVIRKVNLNGIIETIAGTGSPGFNGDNILATSAKLNFPTDIEVSPVSSEIIIVDSNNHRIRKIDSNGNITTIAGTGIPSLNSHGKLSLYGSLNTPTTLSISAVSGNVFISDYENRRIRKLEQFNIEKYTLQVLSSGELRTEMIKDSSNLLAVNYNNIAIDFPKESLKNPELSLATSVYKLDNSAKLTSLEKSISSSIVTVAILDSDCNAIANPFSSPLTITFTDLEFNSTSNYSCIAYNPDSKEWTNNGSVYELKSTNSKFTITCKFSTLSSFAVMEIQSGGSNPLIPTSASSSNNNTFRDSGLGTDAIVAIVVSTVGGVAVVGIIMAVVVGILVIVKRKQNLSKI